MSEVTKEDVNQVHKRIDELVEVTTLIRISVSKIEMAIPEPVELPKRPCDFLEDHIDEHKDNVKTWKHSVIKTAVDILKMAV
ncbi:hypothetical protein LCGC14_3126790, partial [marine sediment metagenome]